MSNKKFVCKGDKVFDEFIIIEALKQGYLFGKPAHEILNISKKDLDRFILEMDGIIEQKNGVVKQEEPKSFSFPITDTNIIKELDSLTPEQVEELNRILEEGLKELREKQ